MLGYWFVFFVVVSGACSIDDKDRCSGDFIWKPEYRACVCPKGTEWTGQGNECEKKATDKTSDQTNDDSGIADAGVDSDAETGTTTRGLGEPCKDDDDCATYQADACLPVPSGGYCSLECETATDCGDGYQCCDCTQSTLVPPGKACAKDADVSLAESLGGCKCE